VPLRPSSTRPTKGLETLDFEERLLAIEAFAREMGDRK